MLLLVYYSAAAAAAAAAAATACVRGALVVRVSDASCLTTVVRLTACLITIALVPAGASRHALIYGASI